MTNLKITKAQREFMRHIHASPYPTYALTNAKLRMVLRLKSQGLLAFKFSEIFCRENCVLTEKGKELL